MALYRLNDSPYWWTSIVNPRTNQRIRKSTKLKDKDKALAFEQTLMASLVLGENHYAVQDKKTFYTWQHAAQRWLQETKEKRDHKNDILKLEWLKQHLGDKALKDIDAALIHKIANIKVKDSSPATANRYLALISAVLHRANKQWNWLTAIPHIRFFKEGERRIRYLTKEQAQVLMVELPKHLKNMALFSLSTGLRASNVTGLTWSQVDLKRQHIWIYADQAKGGKPIAVPLNALALEVLQQQIGKHQSFVFTYGGKPVTRPNNHAWRKALKRAGITDFRWHDLRHTWASWHIQAGTPLHVLQELGGWCSYEMVQRYAHLSSEHLHKFSKNTEHIDLLNK